MNRLKTAGKEASFASKLEMARSESMLELERGFLPIYRASQILNGIEMKISEHPSVVRLCNRYRLPLPSTIEFVTTERSGKESVYFNVYANSGVRGRRMRLMTCVLARGEGGNAPEFNAFINRDVFTSDISNSDIVNFQNYFASDLVLVALDGLGVTRNLQWYSMDMRGQVFPPEPFGHYGANTGGWSREEEPGIGTEALYDMTRLSGMITAKNLGCMLVIRDKDKKLPKKHLDLGKMVGAVELDLGNTMFPRYFIALCRSGAIYESPVVGNGMYWHKFEKVLPDDIFRDIKSGRLPRQMLLEVLALKGVVDFLSLSKGYHRSQGNVPLRHASFLDNEKKSIQAGKIRGFIDNGFIWPDPNRARLIKKT